MSASERTLKQHLVSYRIKDILLTCHTNTLTGGLDLQHGTVIWCFLVNWYLGLPFHAIDMGQTEGWTDGRTAALLYAPILMAGHHNRAYPPRWKRSICCIYVVCLCVCPTFPQLHVRSWQRFVPVIWHGRGSFLLWRRCDTLCTFGVIEDDT